VGNHRRLGVSLLWVIRLEEISVRIVSLSGVAMQAEGGDKVKKARHSHSRLKGK
jgi:hypothetical protein